MKKSRKIQKIIFTGMLLCALTICASAAGLENFTQKTEVLPFFIDVDPEAWFAPYVRTAAQKGLMKGSSAEIFNPRGNVTLAETVTIASRLHSIYHTGGENFTQGPVWYQVYLDYAKQNGIWFPDTADVNRQATRAEFARIVASAFPPEGLAAINVVADGEIPDVPSNMPGAEEIYTLYRAGVLTGNDKAGTFAPGSSILRSEVAAIVSRMADANARVLFDLQEEQAPAVNKPQKPQKPADKPTTPDKPQTPETPKPPIVTGPAIEVAAVEAQAGQKQVAVDIRIRNNPGIAAMALTLSYDSGITLTDVVYNDQLTGEIMQPQTMKNPTRLIWLNPFENVNDDFLLATAYFTVLDTGSHSISVTYDPDDIYDLREENVYFEIVQGMIFVK